MVRASSPVREDAIRRALARLVSGGPDSVWLPQVQPLLELPEVKERVERGREDASEALRAVLLEAIEELGQSQYRNLLEIVLGLTPQAVKLSAGERRALAGETFRGGQRPVTAGTIRQHHERRAISELAKRLTTRGEERSGAPEAQEWTEWHPAIREVWAQQKLSLWRLSISDYNPARVREVLQALMQEHKIGAWAAYEMYGPFDLLLEAWLPLSAWVSGFESALSEAFGGRLVLFDAFSVDEVVAHWVWADEEGEMRRPSPRILAEPPTERQLARLRVEHEKHLARYVEMGVAARVHAEPGIGFLIAIAGLRGHSLLSVDERLRLKSLIRRVLAEAGKGALSQAVLLRGSGFADYVLQGRIQPQLFHRLRELMGALDESLRVAEMRTHTFVFAGAAPLLRESGLYWEPSTESPLSARELLQEDESPTLEVRSSAFADLLPEDRFGATWADSAAGKGLLKTVTAMLNSNGGTIVLGACPHDRAIEDRRFTGRRVEGAPIVGDYLVIGIDEELAGKPDSYMRRVDRMLRQFIEPDPRVHLELRLDRVEDRTLLVITIFDSPDEWFYFKGDSKEYAFLVRNSAGVSEQLLGREADVYKRQSPRF